MFQEDLNSPAEEVPPGGITDLTARGVQRKPVGTAPALPKISKGSEESLMRALNLGPPQISATPRGPREMPQFTNAVGPGESIGSQGRKPHQPDLHVQVERKPVNHQGYRPRSRESRERVTESSSPEYHTPSHKIETGEAYRRISGSSHPLPSPPNSANSPNLPTKRTGPPKRKPVASHAHSASNASNSSAASTVSTNSAYATPRTQSGADMASMASDAREARLSVEAPPPLPPKSPAQLRAQSPERTKRSSHSRNSSYSGEPKSPLSKISLKNAVMGHSRRPLSTSIDKISGPDEQEFSHSETEDEDFEDDNDESFERSKIATGTIRGRSNMTSSIKYWKYHILKYSKDMYLTTNPDQAHIKSPVGPSYYVDTNVGDSQFRMSFNCIDSRQPSMVVTATDKTFALAVGQGSFDQEAAAMYNALLTQGSIHLHNRSKPVRCAQYSVTLPASEGGPQRELVIGNRLEETTRLDPRTGQSYNTTRVSSKVYAFLRGQGPPDSDVILAVLRRRSPKRKRVFKDGLHWLNSKHDDNRSTEGEGGDRSGTASTSSTFETVDTEQTESDREKIGWLYILDSAVELKRQEPYIWTIITGLTTAVAYNQRKEDRERSLHHRLGKLKRWSAHAVTSLQQRQARARSSTIDGPHPN
uniref:ARAD1B10626p n=1 Tax=Blastobotrys adeninivorans TaxID=409370 RepID=A0A060TAW4_BLAAD